jgi:hypothetical protein
MYTDPSGENPIETLLNILSFPARVLSDGFQWIDDKMNGVTRPNGYFNWSYLSGQTEPGATFNANNANVVPYGDPAYIPINPLARIGHGINPDNSIADQWNFEWYWAGGTIGFLTHKESNKKFGMIKTWGQWYQRQVMVKHDETDLDGSIYTTNLPQQDYSGFWGALNYFWTGGIADGYRYDFDGHVIGPAPLMGNPPVPAFKGGSVIKGLKTLQTGKHTLNNSTLKALNLTQEEGKKAIEALKKANDGLRNNTHFIIKADGSLVHPHTGEIIDNILYYVY